MIDRDFLFSSAKSGKCNIFIFSVRRIIIKILSLTDNMGRCVIYNVKFGIHLYWKNGYSSHIVHSVTLVVKS